MISDALPSLNMPTDYAAFFDDVGIFAYAFFIDYAALPPRFALMPSPPTLLFITIR